MKVFFKTVVILFIFFGFLSSFLLRVLTKKCMKNLDREAKWQKVLSMYLNMILFHNFHILECTIILGSA